MKKPHPYLIILLLLLCTGIIYFSDPCEAKEKVVKLWEFKADDAIASPFTLDDNGVYFGSRDRFIYAIDRESGKLRWRFPTLGFIRGGAQIKDGVLFIGSSDYSLYAIKASTGELEWRFVTEGEILGCPLAVDQRIVFGSNDRHIYCLDLKNGKLLWKYKTGDTVESRPAVDGNIVYTGSGDNNIYAINMDTGKVVWTYSGNAGVDGGLLVEKGVLYAPCQDGFLYAIKSDSGTLKWKSKTGDAIETFPVSDMNRNIFIGGGNKNGNVSSIDINGNIVWQKTLPGSVFGAVTLAGKRLWAGSDNGVLYGINIDNAEDLITINDKAAVWGGVVSKDSIIYWGNADGIVQAWQVVP